MAGILRNVCAEIETNQETLPTFKVHMDSVGICGWVNIMTIEQNATAIKLYDKVKPLLPTNIDHKAVRVIFENYGQSQSSNSHPRVVLFHQSHR